MNIIGSGQVYVSTQTRKYNKCYFFYLISVYSDANSPPSGIFIWVIFKYIMLELYPLQVDVLWIIMINFSKDYYLFQLIQDCLSCLVLC